MHNEAILILYFFSSFWIHIIINTLLLHNFTYLYVFCRVAQVYNFMNTATRVAKIFTKIQKFDKSDKDISDLIIHTENNFGFVSNQTYTIVLTVLLLQLKQTKQLLLPRHNEATILPCWCKAPTSFHYMVPWVRRLVSIMPTRWERTVYVCLYINIQST